MLTLQELKRVTEIPEEKKKAPTAKSLQDGGKKVVWRKIDRDTELSVYMNGYAVYRIGNRNTVFSIHTCGDYQYNMEAGTVLIKKTVFDMQEWHIRLMLEGEDRLLRNMDAQEREKNISYHAISEEWLAIADMKPSPMEQIIRRESIDELLSLLTERQYFVVCQYFFKQKTQKQISEELGVTPSAVSRILYHSIQKMRSGSALRYMRMETMRQEKGRSFYAGQETKGKEKLCIAWK